MIVVAQLDIIVQRSIQILNLAASQNHKGEIRETR
ncbi:hypothetical protein MNBD_PLANCTO02-2382 [hydrothermal vent metagenome]|uniref:Uncharacterized protein n=1 Tax=hydrothermal vent metagenome TaxID=652676 RepID=A0A3B1DL45_9ZZZZ